MERYRTIVKLDEIRKLYDGGEYEAAGKMADEIKTEKIKDTTDLFLLASVYRKKGEYAQAKAFLRRIYEKKSSWRVLEELMDVCLAEKNPEEAAEYLKVYAKLSGGDPRNYIYEYRIGRQMHRPDEELLPVLQTLKAEEYTEKYAYELAKLYHKLGMKKECEAECADLILWFGEGTYVERAKVLQAYYRGELSAADIHEEARKRIREAEERQARELENRRAYEAETRAKEEQEAAEREKREAEKREAQEDDISAFLAATSEEVPEVGKTAEQASFSELVQEESLAAAESEEAHTEKEPVKQESSAGKGNKKAKKNKKKGKHAKAVEDAQAEAAAAAQAQTVAATQAETVEDAQAQTVTAAQIVEATQAKAVEDAQAQTVAAAQAEVTEDAQVQTVAAAQAKVAEDAQAQTIAAAQAETAEEAEDTQAETAEAATEETIVPTEDAKEQAKAVPTIAIEEEPEEAKQVLSEPKEELANKLAQNEVVLEKSLHAFARIEEVRKQLLRMLDVMCFVRQKCYCLIITGEQGSGRTTLGGYIVKTFFDLGLIKSLKTAKINAEKLNKINLDEKQEQLAGGCLIVENAGAMTEETAKRLLKSGEKKGILSVIILEDNLNAINKLLRKSQDCSRAFGTRIHLPKYGEAELMAFALDVLDTKDYVADAGAKKALQGYARQVLGSGEGNYLEKMTAYAKAAVEAADKRTEGALLAMAIQGKFHDIGANCIVAEDFMTLF